MNASAKTVIDSFREAVQDLLVPELKALRVSVDAIKTEMQLRDERLQESIDGVRTELRVRAESLHNENQLMRESVQNLAQKLDFAIDIRERLAALEARLPRQ
jgi:excinuclease UvrABC helicase subunit UvrB